MKGPRILKEPNDTKDNNPIRSDWSFVTLAERLPKGLRFEIGSRQLNNAKYLLHLSLY